jgi:hypothetical protein
MSQDESDPEIFPGKCVARLSDYASIVRRMREGDVNGAFSDYDLNFITWGVAVQAWTRALARDPTLSEKLKRLIKAG